MHIGNVEIKGRSVLAPMAGITDLPFRLICREMGAALVYTEMISAEGLIRDMKRTLKYLETDPAERPVAFQIFGSKPGPMARAAEAAAKSGADIVDINMGCPVRKVVKGGSGSALLKDPQKAAEVIRAVVEATPVPVTVKLRTGWGANDFVAVELAKAAEDAGAAAVTVHGRYAAQGFSGRADWSKIAAVKKAVGIPVIGNGDVCTAGDALRMVEETGCDLVMVGRGALGNPWLFAEIEAAFGDGACPPAPDAALRGETLLRHVRMVVARAGAVQGVRLMRKHAAWYSRGLSGSPEFRGLVNRANTPGEFEEIVRGFFFETPQGVRG